MGRKTDLSENEKSLILQKTAKCVPIEAIAKRTETPAKNDRFLMDSFLRKKRSDKGSFKIRTDCNLGRIYQAMRANPGKNRGDISCSRIEKCAKIPHSKVLREMGKYYSPIKSPPMNAKYCKNGVQ